MGKVKLNPELMIGDEIMVVSTEGIHDFGAPELFKPYVVVGIKYSHNSSDPNRKDNRPDYDKPFYQIEPLGMTDEDRIGAMLAGGGRMKPMYIFSPEDGHGGSDQWILRAGFLRGELNEQTEPNLNPTLEVDDEILLVDIKKYGLADPPKLYTPYKVTRIQYPNQYQPSNAPIFYMVYPVDETQEEEEKRREEREREWDKGEHVVGEHNGDTWIFNPGFKRGEHLTEQEEPQDKEAIDTVQDIVDSVYLHIVNNLGKSEYVDETPKVELHRDIYERLSGVEGMDGEDSKTSKSEYESHVNTIYIYYPNMKNEKDVIQALLHEYTHYLQDPEKWEEHREEGYENNPYEQQAADAEDNWEDYLIYLQENINEHNQPGLSPDLEEGDIIRIIDIDGEHANMPDRFGIYKVYGVMGLGGSQEPYYKLSGETAGVMSGVMHGKLWNAKYLYHGDTWIPADVPMATKVDRKTISEHKEEFNQRLTMGDIIRVVDVDKESTYEQPTYDYDTGNASGNSLRTNHRREQVHGEDTYPRPMKLYMVTSKSTYRPKDRDYLNPYWMIWPVDKDGKVQTIKDLHQPILTEKDTWMTVKKHHSNITGDIEAKQKEYDDSGRNIISRILDVRRLDEKDEPEIIIKDKTHKYDKKDYEDFINYTIKELGIETPFALHIEKEPTGDYTGGTYRYKGGSERIKVRSKGRSLMDILRSIAHEMVHHKQKEDGKFEEKEVVTDIPEIGGIIEDEANAIAGRLVKKYGQENKHLYEQVEPAFDEFSDAELEKRRTYDDFSDEEKREIDQEHVDMTPFKPMEVKILKTLHKNLDRSELQKLSTDTPEAYGSLDKKFWDIMKLFGIEESNTEQNTRVSRYAKWALDNWTEDGDYGNIEDPIKVPLKWYSVERDESGSQIEYKSGEAEVLGFDEDDAGERADYDFYAWGGEMETNDYGDYESYDSEITNSEFLRMDEGLSRVLREETWDSSGNTIDSSKYQDLLFNFWINHGPTLDRDKLKLLGFNMDEYEDRGVVWDNLRQYYGDQELKEIIHERLEGLHDSWSYEYIVTSFSVDDTGEVTIDILINGDVMIPISMESGEVIDMSLWDINEKAAEETGGNYYDDVYEEARATVSDDISEVLLKDIPIDMNLDYMDISEPGTFETYVEENELEMITEDDDGYIDDMVYIDEPREKHIKRMGKDLGSLEGFPIDDFKNVPPPTNESNKTEEEIGYLEDIPVDKNLVDSADEMSNHFSKFLSTKGLEYPKEELRPVMRGVKAIILKLKYHYNRPRPWQIAQEKGLTLNSETLKSSSSPSYPSGHATQGRFVARYLADLYPEYRDEITQIGEDIAFSRNMAKVHYPSDSAFGKFLADEMYNYVYQPQEELELQVNEQVMVDKGDRLKSDIFRILSNTFILTPTNHSEIKDNEGNYYGIYDTKQEEYVNMSDLIEGVLDFISFGVESGDFKEEDIQKGITSITDWVSLMMNQKKDLVN